MSKLLRNEQIPNGLYTLIDIDGTKSGVKPIAKIREICEENDYDCVLVNADVRPGVVRLEEKMDEGKRRYQDKKTSKKQQQKETKTKTYVVDKPLTIQDNDLNRKMNQVISSVRKNYSVTFTFKAFGRYSSGNQWEEILKRFDKCIEYIESHENITLQSKKENENTVFAVFRFTNKK